MDNSQDQSTTNATIQQEVEDICAEVFDGFVASVSARIFTQVISQRLMGDQSYNASAVAQLALNAAFVLQNVLEMNDVSCKPAVVGGLL
jgi:hypothetical protein